MTADNGLGFEYDPPIITYKIYVHNAPPLTWRNGDDESQINPKMIEVSYCSDKPGGTVTVSGRRLHRYANGGCQHLSTGARTWVCSPDPSIDMSMPSWITNLLTKAGLMGVLYGP
jgi:hypothetical protein